MPAQHRPRRGFIASFAGPRAVRSDARAALGGLGYELHDPSALCGAARVRHGVSRAVLYLVDESRLNEVPSVHSDPDTPMIVLRGTRLRDVADPRVVGYAPRPAALRDLYPLIQRALERTPRSAPRVRTLLSARCIRSDRRWVGRVTSLSEGGCLFRSREPLEGGVRVNVQLALPRDGLVTARAVCVRQQNDAAGLAFSAPPAQLTQSIGRFVADRLATARNSALAG